MAKPYTGPAPILVGYDASDDAVAALEYAAAEAGRTQTMLDIVYVADDTVANSAWGVLYDSDELRHTGRELLVEAITIARSQGAAKKRIRTQVALGTPVSVLTQLSSASSLLVVGRSGNTGSDKLFAGSTAVGVAATAKCPVVVIGENSTGPAVGPVGVGVESSGKGELALAWALKNRGARRVRVLSVCPAPSGRLFRQRISAEQIERVTEATRERVAHLVARSTAPEVASLVSTEVSYGSPVHELVARTGELSLLVVEANPTFPTYTVGGTVRGVMAHAQCPVVIVR